LVQVVSFFCFSHSLLSYWKVYIFQYYNKNKNIRVKSSLPGTFSVNLPSHTSHFKIMIWYQYCPILKLV
jgi:hypothetical protein